MNRAEIGEFLTDIERRVRAARAALQDGRDYNLAAELRDIRHDAQDAERAVQREIARHQGEALRPEGTR